jgi:threonine/homoserine efflux transporter RhtA
MLLAAGDCGGIWVVQVSLVICFQCGQLILSTEPVFTAIIAFLLLGERMTIIQIAGRAN